MHAATVIERSRPTTAQPLGPRRNLSWRVAMLAQEHGLGEEPAATDVMIYRQPASDVPVPASWRESRRTPTAPTPRNDERRDAPASDDDASHADAQAMADWRPFFVVARVAAWMTGGLIACTLVGGVMLSVANAAETAPAPSTVVRTIGPR